LRFPPNEATDVKSRISMKDEGLNLYIREQFALILAPHSTEAHFCIQRCLPLSRCSFFYLH